MRLSGRPALQLVFRFIAIQIGIRMSRCGPRVLLASLLNHVPGIRLRLYQLLSSHE